MGFKGISQLQAGEQVHCRREIVAQSVARSAWGTVVGLLLSRERYLES